MRNIDKISSRDNNYTDELEAHHTNKINKSNNGLEPEPQRDHLSLGTNIEGTEQIVALRSAEKMNRMAPPM